MKSTIKLNIIIMLSLNVFVVSQSFATDALVNVYQYDPFDLTTKHPLAHVNLEIIDSDFGAVSDVKCSKSARNTGLAKCRYVNSKCNTANKSEIKYLVQLEREKTGLILRNNLFDLVVNHCEIIPPSDYTFIYDPKKVEIYKKSNSNISSQIGFIGSGQLKDKSLWSDSNTKDKFNNYFQYIDSNQVRKNIADSNNLAVLYANIANSYSPDSDKYIEYQTIAKNYERLSVLSANHELSKAFTKTLEKTDQEIQITIELADYINNVIKIKGNKEGIIINCKHCNKRQLEEGINLMAEAPELNTKSIKAMKEVMQAMNNMGIGKG